MIEVWINKISQKENADIFKRIMKKYPWMNFRKPNEEKSPWHIVGTIPFLNGYDLTVNFWPHKAKAQIEGDNVIVGWDNIMDEICRQIDISQDETFDDDIME